MWYKYNKIDDVIFWKAELKWYLFMEQRLMLVNFIWCFAGLNTWPIIILKFYKWFAFSFVQECIRTDLYADDTTIYDIQSDLETLTVKLARITFNSSKMVQGNWNVIKYRTKCL